MSDQAAGGSTGKIAVITVHGTNDTADSDDGAKWFQRGSEFSKALLEKLRARGVDAEIVPYRWSGKNSGQARERAADGLADRLKGWNGDYAGVHIVGHSHGGNVANEAADFVRWGRKSNRPKNRIASLTTVGTPFFKRSSSTGETLGGVLFMALTVLSGLVFAFFGLIMVYMMVTGELHTPIDGDAAAPAGNSDVIVLNSIASGLILLNLVGMILMARLAISGLRRLLRPKDMKDATSKITAIWHSNDEAIAFLQKVDQLPVAPIARGALYDGSRTNAIIWGVRAVLIGAGLGAYQLLFAQPLLLADPESGWWLPFGPVGTDAIIPGVPNTMLFTALFTPIIFFGVYLLFRFVFGFLPEVFLRDGLNKGFAGTLKSMAFGRDGDVTLSEVATLSHTHPTEQIIVQGGAQQRMQQMAEAAASTLIAKYRWSLLSVGTDPNAALKDLANDAMTWDSLIHTIYFDQDEVVEMIADTIAAQVKPPA
jgi:hypothetical protein